MVDIHAHILPGLDDGAGDYDESMEMIEMAARSGVRVLAATPHSNQEGMYENYYDSYLEHSLLALQDAVREEGIPVRLCPGMEIMNSDQVPSLLRKGKLIGLNKGRYCLTEFWFDEIPEIMERQLAQIMAAGKIPVIAHPERYDCVQEQPQLVRRWIGRGYGIQVNKGSVLGRFGRYTERTAWKLLQERLVTCISSDAHKPYRRTTDMSEIRSCISRYFSEEDAYRLLSANPGKILGI